MPWACLAAAIAGILALKASTRALFVVFGVGISVEKITVTPGTSLMIWSIRALSRSGAVARSWSWMVSLVPALSTTTSGLLSRSHWSAQDAIESMR